MSNENSSPAVLEDCSYGFVARRSPCGHLMFDMDTSSPPRCMNRLNTLNPSFKAGGGKHGSVCKVLVDGLLLDVVCNLWCMTSPLSLLREGGYITVVKKSLDLLTTVWKKALSRPNMTIVVNE